MADVAREAGVSTMTVSRALKDERTVSPETLRRIRRAVDELGYVLDQSAGALSSGRTGFVAALVPSLNNSNFADTVRGITATLSDAGRQLLLAYTDYSIETEERLIEAMLRRRPEGVILTGGRHTDRARKLLQHAGIPVIETWDLPPEPIRDVVGFSNAEACRALVHRLYERGYRNIAFIGGTTNRDTRGADRRIGYQRAIEELGLPGGRVISFGSPPISMEQGAEALGHLLRQWPDADAAVCVSDLSAFGAMMECHRRGLHVPERIAIAGFGDFEIARCCYPSITTVAVDSEEIGRLAARRLLSALDAGPEAVAETIVVPFRVIERESTRRG
jgi:LacI family gluconate utilization system Gnt-I transcriptional repressor